MSQPVAIYFSQLSFWFRGIQQIFIAKVENMEGAGETGMKEQGRKTFETVSFLITWSVEMSSFTLCCNSDNE